MEDMTELRLIKKMDKNSRLIREKDNDLRKKYADEYIAIDGGAVIAHSKNADALRATLDKRKKDNTTVLVQYIPRSGMEILF